MWLRRFDDVGDAARLDRRGRRQGGHVVENAGQRRGGGQGVRTEWYRVEDTARLEGRGRPQRGDPAVRGQVLGRGGCE